MASKKSTAGAVLVTGGTGFLGRHLCTAIRAAEPRRAIRSLARDVSTALATADVEPVLGDVCVMEDCTRAMVGVSEVYHLAGVPPRAAFAEGEPFRVHVEGTRNVLTAAAQAGVRRVVVVTTSGTVAVSRDGETVSNEQSPYRTATVLHWPFYLSKIYQEQTALRMGEELGLDVVIVGPSALLGPGAKVASYRLPLVPKGGGVAFVDVRDAAAACVLAMQGGKRGERYLVSAANMALESFVGRLARLSGQTSPRAIATPKMVGFAAGLLGSLLRHVGVGAPIDARELAMAEHTWYVDSAKAVRELGWTHREAQDTLVATVASAAAVEKLDEAVS